MKGCRYRIRSHTASLCIFLDSWRPTGARFAAPATASPIASGHWANSRSRHSASKLETTERDRGSAKLKKLISRQMATAKLVRNLMIVLHMRYVWIIGNVLLGVVVVLVMNK